MLKLYSKKFILQQGTPRSLPRGLPSRGWLWGTVDGQGGVRPAYLPMLGSLHRLSKPAFVPALQDLSDSMKARDADATALQFGVLCRSAAGRGARVRSWSELREATNCYGPPQLALIIEHLWRDFKHALVQILRARNDGLSMYALAAILEKLGRGSDADADLGIQLLAQSWASGARRLALAAFLYGANGNWPRIVHVVNSTDIPSGFRLPAPVEATLARVKNCNECAEYIATLARKKIDLRSTTMEVQLRRVYGGSEYAASTIKEVAAETVLPLKFYPFIVRMLSLDQAAETAKSAQKTATSDPHDEASTEPDGHVAQGEPLPLARSAAILQQMFDGPLIQLASTHTSLVLYLLLLHTVITRGVQATHELLRRWGAYDRRGVSMEAWLLVFREFRRLGLPGKCNDVLSEVLAKHKLSLPFAGEYLLAVAQFDNIHVFARALCALMPAVAPVLTRLGIAEHVARMPSPDVSAEFTIRHIPAAVLGFPVGRLHESVLAITYQSVLATVERRADLDRLFELYVAYAKRVPTHIFVTDLFVKKMLGLRDGGGLEPALELYLSSLKRLELRRHAGRNNCVSVGMLVKALVHSGDLPRALRLVHTVFEHPALLLNREAVLAISDALGEERATFAAWCVRTGIPL